MSNPAVDAASVEDAAELSQESQDWLLLATCLVAVGLWCLPCLCGSLGRGSIVSEVFLMCTYSRMHVFYISVSIFNFLVVCTVIGLLPGWTFNDFVITVATVTVWVLDRLQKFLVSSAMLFGLWLVWRFRQRILIAAGVDHVTLVRFSWWDLIDPVASAAGISLAKPFEVVELLVWKASNMPSASYLKPNDCFVEVHCGNNEVLHGRVRNNAGSYCIFRERFQLNISVDDFDTKLTILLRDQDILTNVEIARLELLHQDICKLLETSSGCDPELAVEWAPDGFCELSLHPRGSIWLRLQRIRGDSDFDDVESQYYGGDALGSPKAEEYEKGDSSSSSARLYY
ncbi:hypothetical protein FOL47_009660 [Perkinsus chesapeaki]|uniref:Uncharacterized protein n=1 Tax=Perkinsus chesapeaki TaxID=330153 RepID=A0A7J6MRC0_PERCH|nr:hypothetical protein FOL47_009660 [Perkinsus chesapeaki]